MHRLLPALACLLALAGTAVADTSSLYYFSLEWLTDASDSVVEATVVPGPYLGNPSLSKTRVKVVHRVLKKAGTCPAAGEDIPCHVAGGKAHRVLLFSRPDKDKPGERIHYAVFLAEPKAKVADPFTMLPLHGSSFERLAFNYPACVAIDKSGKVLTDPAAVTRLVEARIKADPKRVSAAGKNIKVGPKVDDGDDHNLMVPAEAKAK